MWLRPLELARSLSSHTRALVRQHEGKAFPECAVEQGDAAFGAYCFRCHNIVCIGKRYLQLFTCSFCRGLEVLAYLAFHLLAHDLAEQATSLQSHMKSTLPHALHERCYFLFKLFGQGFGSEGKGLLNRDDAPQIGKPRLAVSASRFQVLQELDCILNMSYAHVFKFGAIKIAEAAQLSKQAGLAAWSCCHGYDHVPTSHLSSAHRPVMPLLPTTDIPFLPTCRTPARSHSSTRVKQAKRKGGRVPQAGRDGPVEFLRQKYEDPPVLARCLVAAASRTALARRHLPLYLVWRPAWQAIW